MHVCIKRRGLRCAVHAVSPLLRIFPSASPHVCHKSCLSSQGHTACSSTNTHKHPWTHTHHISIPLSLKVKPASIWRWGYRVRETNTWWNCYAPSLPASVSLPGLVGAIWVLKLNSGEHRKRVFVCVYSRSNDSVLAATRRSSSLCPGSPETDARSAVHTCAGGTG